MLKVEAVGIFLLFLIYFSLFFFIIIFEMRRGWYIDMKKWKGLKA